MRLFLNISSPIVLCSTLFIGSVGTQQLYAESLDEIAQSVDALAQLTDNASSNTSDSSFDQNKHDVVLLNNGHRLYGVLDQLPSANQNVVHLTLVEGGTIGLNNELIRNIEPSLDRRMEKLDELNRDEQLKLAKLCLRAQRYDDALRILENAHNEESLDINYIHQLAYLYDRETRYQAAIELYKLYRNMGGDDPATLNRLAELEAAEKEHAKAMQEYYDKANELPPIEDGFESKSNWKSENTKYANPAKVKIIESGVGNQKNKILEYQFRGGKHHKSALVLKTPINASSNSHISFYMLNEGLDNLKLSLAVKAGRGWDYFESTTLKVSASDEWQEVQFDLRASDFKSEGTNWAHRARISDIRDIKEIQLQVHNGNKDGKLLIDGISLLNLGQIKKGF